MPKGIHEGTAWPEARVQMLRQLKLTGASASQIASALNLAEPGAGVTRSAVIGKLHRVFGAGTPKAAKLSKSAKHLMHTRHAPKKAASSAPRLPRTKPPPERAPTVEPIPFSRRRPFQCAFIFGEPYGPVGAHSPCCGQPIAPNEAKRPYCAEHLKVIINQHQGRRAA